MYRDNKTAFGQPAATTFGFGAAAATPGVTPFGTPGLANAAGATAFGKPATAPGQPVFGSGATTSLFGGAATGTAGGASVPQGGSLFGGSNTGATFGMTHQPQPAFGGFSSTAATPNIFGAAGGTAGPGTSGGGVLFGVASTSTATVGGQQVATSNAVVPFGAASKPASAFGTLGGFGQTATAPQQTGGTLFGNTSGGMFSTGFGSTAGPATGAGTPVKFSPFMGTDTMIKNGAQQTINTRHQCITCMKEYESKSLEELRMEDYAAGRRGGAGGQAVVTPGFGATGGVFGAGTGGTTAGSLFGKPATGANPAGGFSAPVTTSANSAFSFSVPGSNLFGGGNTNKPFGAAAPQPSTLFGGGTTTNAFGGQSMGFGTFGQQNQSIGLFGQNKSPFASTGTTGLTFGAGAPQNTGAAAQPAQPLFGAPKSTAPTSTFGTTNAFGVTTSTAPPAFGSAFGTAGTSTAAGTSVFGQPFKPSTTSAFSFGQTTQANSGLGLNLGQPSLFGNTSAKPGGGGTGVGGSLFGGGTTGTSGGGALFGGGTNTSLGTNFGTSAMGLSNTGGSSLFGGGGTIGGLGSSLGGGTQLGQGMLGGNTGLLGGGGAVQWGGGTGGQVGGLPLGTQSGGGLLGSSMNQSFLGNAPFGGVGSNSIGGTLGGPGGGSSNSGTGGGAQQVMSVSSLPFGDSRLFRDLLPSSAKMDDVLKTTNPVAQKALMAGTQFKVSPHAGNAGKVKVKPLGASALSKRSLFDGLEEEDASLLTVFSPRSASKRLTLKPKPPGSTNVADSSANSLANSLSTPSGAITSSNGPRISLRARLAGSSPWGNDSPVPVSESKNQWIHKQSSTTKQSPNGALQVQNSNHGSSNPNAMNESASDLENTIADLRTRLDGSGSTPISSLRMKDSSLLETRGRPSKEAVVEDSLDEVDVSSSEVGNNNSLKGVLEGEFDNHPTGIVLRRSGYYTIPSMDELATMVEEINDGEQKIKSVVVENFTVGREGYGNVFFPDTFDVAGLNLDEIVHFRHKEIVVYPGDDEEERGKKDDEAPSSTNENNKKINSLQKPPSGCGLNRRAQVTLDRVWPIDKVTRCPVTDPERLSAMNYEGKLQRVCAQMHTRFVEYRPQTGSWVFKVDHFSKYGLSDSDDEDCPPFLPTTAGATAGPNAALCANETNKKAKKIPLKTINKRVHQDDHMDQSMAEEDSMDLGRTDGWPDDGSAHGKNTSGNVTLENGFHKNAAALALSPTTQMAEQLGTSTHKVQLMKASFFSDDDDDHDDIDGEYVDRRPHQELRLGKTRDLTEKKQHGKERTPGKSSGELLRTQIQCRDAFIQRAGFPTDRGGEGMMMMRPYGPPSTASSSSTCPLRESLSQRHHPPLAAAASSSTTSSSLFPPPHPLVHRSKMAVLKHRGHHVKNADLVKNVFPGVESQSLLLADLGLFFGRTFKCGWGPGMKLSVITSSKVVADSSSTQGELYSQLLPLSNGRSSSDFSNLVVQQLQLLGGTRDSGTFQGWIEPHLWIQLQHSVVSFEGGAMQPEDTESGLCPRFTPRAGKDIIHAHRDQSVSSGEDVVDPGEFHIPSYARLVWDLCCALWGQLPELEDDGENVNYNNHKVSMARRRALSDWLQQAVEGECKKRRRWKGRQEERGEEVHTNAIFDCLTRKRLLEACEAAQKKGDHFVALMLASSNWNCRAQLRKQLSSWSRVGADEFITEGRMKIIALRAGAPLLPTISVRHGTIDCCDGLDWRRAFAMHLWYVCSPVCSITDALMEYESAFSDEAMEDKSCYAPPPVPPYQEQVYHRIEDGKLPHYDLCFHLLKLYSCRSHSLEALLNTPTHTPDPMDVRLSWLLCVSLTALGYSHLSGEARASLHQSMSALLESHGLWHWALFPLLHLENPLRRKASVLDVLSRHVMLIGMGSNADGDAAYSQKEKFVIECLHVPSSWVFYAKSKLAASLHRHGDAAWCLAKAGLWNKCHEVILNYIAADAVINENLDYLRDLLGELATDERSQTISGWSCGGQVFWDYLQVLSEIETVMKQQQRPKVESSDVSQGYWLERLQPKLSSLCTRLISLPCKTAKDRLCQSEISKRIAHVVRALVLMMDKGKEEVVGSPSASRVLAYLVTQLPMPPDYLIQELRHLVEVHLDGVTASGENTM